MKNLPEQLLPLFIISRIHQLPLLERRENSILFPPPPPLSSRYKNTVQVLFPNWIK